MSQPSGLTTALLLSAFTLPLVLADNPGKAPQAGEKGTTITWKKTAVDRTFRSEGVAVADVNKDGKLDILIGDAWYEGPDWKKRHIIRKDRAFDLLQYSQCFCCWADDLNGDGWPDLIVIGFPGQPCHWYENPKGEDRPWKEHVIWHSACNETPQYLDLFGGGKRVLVMGWQPRGQENQGQMAWFAPGSDPTLPWEMHPISEPSRPGKEIPGTFRYSHGLGAGDINGDGRLDVICTAGWWEQPVTDDGKTPWRFHPADLGPNCADMFAHDVDGDGKADVISSSAHDFGIWWHQQKPGNDGNPAFLRHDVCPKMFSQSHALHLVDISGDGLKDLVTGRRWWAHGPKGDPGSDGPAYLYWFEARRGKDKITRFVPHEIDNDSGIGTQFFVGDINGDGLPDIVTANKKGIHVFEQVRR
jgi:hypothetical protein